MELFLVVVLVLALAGSLYVGKLLHNKDMAERALNSAVAQKEIELQHFVEATKPLETFEPDPPKPTGPPKPKKKPGRKKKVV